MDNCSLYPFLTYFGMSEFKVHAVCGGVGYDTPCVLASPLDVVLNEQPVSLSVTVPTGQLWHEGRVVLLVGVVRAAHQRAGGHVLESHL